MTTDETRDELARMDGWRIYNIGGTKLYLAPGKPDDADCQVDCPHPPTLDAANAAVPEGWEWKRYTDMDDGEVYAAWRSVGEGVWADEVNVPDHGRGHEMDDLYALALACRRAMEKRNAK